MTKRKFDIPYYYRSQKRKTSGKSYAPNVFAAGSAAAASSGAARVAVGATNMWNSIPPAVVAAVEDATAVGILEDMLVAAAMGGPVLAGGVAAAAGLGYLAGMAIDSVFTQTNPTIENIFIMSGGYSGKFAMSASRSSKGLRDKFQKRGAVAIEETYGSVSDPDIVYIGQSSYNIGVITSSIAFSILRKLFRVGCKIDVKTPYEELPLIDQTPNSGPHGYKIVYTTRDSNGSDLTFLHDIPNDMSLSTLATRSEAGFVLIDIIRESIVVENPRTLTKISLYMTDSPAASNSSPNKLVYMMDMGTEILEIVMASHMVVQNRTRSASGGGSAEIAVVDSQPLKGPVYQFSNGAPKIKGDGPYLLGVNRPEGTILIRGGEMPGTDIISYREPPVKNVFQNVEKSGYVRLAPGSMKSMQVSASCKGFFGNVLFKLRYNNEGGVTSRCYGKSQLVSLEEELNSGSSNNITLFYECQHIAGAHLITSKSPNMQPGYTSSLQTNNP